VAWAAVAADLERLEVQTQANALFVALLRAGLLEEARSFVEWVEENLGIDMNALIEEEESDDA